MLTEEAFGSLMNLDRNLTLEEEGQVFRYYEENGKPKEIRNRIALKNDGLVRKIIKNYAYKSLDWEEFYQEGFLGLLHAVEQFDYKMGNKFSTYACNWIRCYATRYGLNHGKVVRLPVHISECWYRIYQFQKEYESHYGSQPTNAQIAENTGYHEDKVARVKSIVEVADTVSLNQSVKTSLETDTELSEIIHGNTPDIADETVRNVTLEGLQDVLERSLTKRERDVLNYRFGLAGGKPLTLEETGKIFGLTRERIRQIEAAALKKLRHCRYTETLGIMLECVNA